MSTADPASERPTNDIAEEIVKAYGVPCSCSDAWTDRGRHAPECQAEDWAGAYEAIAAALDAERQRTREAEGLLAKIFKNPDCSWGDEYHQIEAFLALASQNTEKA